MPTVRQGDYIPLSLKLFDGATNKYVRAYLTDANGNPITPSYVNLQHIASGLYEDKSVQMPNTEHVTAVYIVYSDSAYTIEDPSYTHATDLFELHVPDFVILQKLLEIKNTVEQILAKGQDFKGLVGVIQSIEELEGYILSGHISLKGVATELTAVTQENQGLEGEINEDIILKGGL